MARDGLIGVAGGRRHPPEVRAAAVAAVASGESLSAVARRHGIDKGMLSRWCSADIPAAQALDRNTDDNVAQQDGGGVVRSLQRRTIAELAHELVCTSLEALTVQARVAGRDAWVEKQSASGLAAYRGAEIDRLLRLLPAFDPDAPAPDVVDVVPGLAEPAGLGDGARDDRAAD